MLKHSEAKDEQECSLCVCSLLSAAKSPGCDMRMQTGTDQQPLVHEVKDQVKCAFVVDGRFARSCFAAIGQRHCCNVCPTGSDSQLRRHAAIQLLDGSLNAV